MLGLIHTIFNKK